MPVEATPVGMTNDQANSAPSAPSKATTTKKPRTAKQLAADERLRQKWKAYREGTGPNPMLKSASTNSQPTGLPTNPDSTIGQNAKPTGMDPSEESKLDKILAALSKSKSSTEVNTKSKSSTEDLEQIISRLIDSKLSKPTDTKSKDVPKDDPPTETKTETKDKAQSDTESKDVPKDDPPTETKTETKSETETKTEQKKPKEELKTAFSNDYWETKTKPSVKKIKNKTAEATEKPKPSSKYNGWC